MKPAFDYSSCNEDYLISAISLALFDFVTLFFGLSILRCLETEIHKI